MLRLRFLRCTLGALLFLTNAAQAQKIISTPVGTFKIQSVNKWVYKLTFLPEGYTKSEQFSKAVILPFTNIPAPDAQWLGNQLVLKDGEVIKPFVDSSGYQGLDILLKPGLAVYGGGERALPLNRRGYRFNLYNNPWYGYSDGADNINFSVPFFTTSDHTGYFFDNVSRGYADLGHSEPNLLRAGFYSGEINVYVIHGNSYAQVLQLFHQLTGNQPLPPRWALGNFMSRFGYSSQAQTESIIQQMDAEKMKFDAVIFDLFWFGDSIKGTMGNLDWVNRKRWPDPAGMINSFKKKNIQSILIAEPFILQHTRKFEASLPYLAKDAQGKPFMLQDFYFGVGGLLDIFRKKAGDWIWKAHYQQQQKNGIHAWWTDLGEPEKHPSAMLHDLNDWGISRKLSADEVHNAYGHYWNKMLFEHFTSDNPDKRLFHLNRSGFAGSQRFAIFPWSGDISRSWEGYRAQLKVMLGMSMSGIPYIHADAGGFAGGSGEEDLYQRWLQFAAFTPVFRPHGTALFDLDPQAYSFPSEPALMHDPVKSGVRNTIRLRYALLPYNYTLAYRQAVAGDPLVAPLYFHFEKDTTATGVGDEFCWGSDLLIAPVLQKNAISRSVYLPQFNWYPLYFNGNGLESKAALKQGWHDVATPADQIPFFAREGAFIPMCSPDAGINASDVKADTLAVHYFYSKQASTGKWFWDDGNSASTIRRGDYLLAQFQAKPDSRNIKLLQWQALQRPPRFQSQPVFIRLFLHGLPQELHAIMVNGKPVPMAALETPSGSLVPVVQWNWNPQQAVQIKLHFKE